MVSPTLAITWPLSEVAIHRDLLEAAQVYGSVRRLLAWSQATIHAYTLSIH
jgi:hypothetical protein